MWISLQIEISCVLYLILVHLTHVHRHTYADITHTTQTVLTIFTSYIQYHICHERTVHTPYIYHTYTVLSVNVLYLHWTYCTYTQEDQWDNRAEAKNDIRDRLANLSVLPGISAKGQAHGQVRTVYCTVYYTVYCMASCTIICISLFLYTFVYIFISFLFTILHQAYLLFLLILIIYRVRTAARMTHTQHLPPSHTQARTDGQATQIPSQRSKIYPETR